MVLDWVLYFLTYNFIIGHELVYINLPVFQSPDFQICLTPHIASLCIVFPITLLTGFWLNKHVTFTQSTLHGARQLARYIMIVAVNLAVNYFGLKLLVEHFAWYPTPSKICITMLTVIISFLLGCVILIGYCVTKAILNHHPEFALFSGTAFILWYVTLNLLLACTRKK